MKKLSLLVGILLCSTGLFARGWSAQKDKQGNWHLEGIKTRNIGNVTYYCEEDSFGNEMCRTEKEMATYLEEWMERGNDEVKIRDIAEVREEKKRNGIESKDISFDEWYNTTFQEKSAAKSPQLTQQEPKENTNNKKKKVKKEKKEQKDENTIQSQDTNSEQKREETKKKGIFKQISSGILSIL